MKNKNHTVGVIGGGFVGSATAWGFRPTNEVKIYDIDPKSATHSLEEVASCDFIFICVPTPPKEDWSVDLSIVEEAISKIKPIYNSEQNIVIKSTVLPQTCRTLSKKFNISISSNPEFLTERRAKWDFVNAAQVLIGSDDPMRAEKIRSLYQERFNSMKYTVTDTVTAEMIKYTLNSFFSTKVSFLNEIKQISKEIGANWSKLIEGFTSDARIGDSHIDVPGPDGKLGFGGKCFPKDLNGLKEFAKKLDLDTTMLEATWEKNLKVRPEG